METYLVLWEDEVDCTFFSPIPAVSPTEAKEKAEAQEPGLWRVVSVWKQVL